MQKRKRCFTDRLEVLSLPVQATVRVASRNAWNGGKMFYQPRLSDSGLAIDPLKALVVPRPIGWISSVDLEGRVNLAPYSFFNLVAEVPPIVFFAPTGTKPNGMTKDSLRNVEATGAFVVNLATFDLREAMNATSVHAEAGVDEAALAGIEMSPSIIVVAPRVAAAQAALECRYLRTVSLPTLDAKRPNNMVLGEVVGVHIADRLVTEGRVDITLAKPIARLGYSRYATISEAFDMKRPHE